MKDIFEAILQKTRETWGPLKLLSVKDVFGRIQNAANMSTEDSNIMQSVFALFTRGLNEREVSAEDFLELRTVEEIFQFHIDQETALYLFTAFVFHPTKDFDSADTVEEKYCRHKFAPSRKALYDHFKDAYEEAHEILCSVIDNIPDQMTNCEIDIDLIDNGELVDMGTWTWDRLGGVTSFRKPIRN